MCDGDVARVVLAPSAAKAYRKLVNGNDRKSASGRVHLGRYFAEFCSRVEPRLDTEKFKPEGKFSDGSGKAIQVFVFKVWQWRLYGVVIGLEGKKSFVGVSVDPNKKQDKANQEILKSVAKRIRKLGFR